MSKLLDECINVNVIYLNAHHLPQKEYERLDEFMDYPNTFGIQAAIYSSGVVIYMDDYKREDLLLFDFPVLATILEMAYEDDIMFVDFYELRREELDFLEIFEWDE